MSTFDETFDYLTMFGLTPATMPMQAAELSEVIKRKKKEWTAQAINPLYQQGARANLERARQFEQIVRDPAALEAYVSYLREVQGAKRAEQEKEVARLVALAVSGPTRPGSKKRVLTVAQRDLIVREVEPRGIPADVVDHVIQSRKISVVEGPAAFAAKLPYKSPAMDRALLSQISSTLRVLGKKSFYELLDLPQRTAPARILSTAQLMYGRWSKSLPKTTECVAWEKSLQACLTYLKDEESKAAYDRGLFNERLDEFVRRVDLLLAAGRFSKEGHALLAQIGVQEYGLSQNTVNQCINARAATQGVSLAKPIAVTITLDGQVQCPRCFRWNATGTERCTGCGGTLTSKCRNPACHQPLSVDAKICDRCGLPASRGGQYVELLRLIDASIATGNFRAALDACGLAQQILPSPQLAERATRASEIRVLSASIKRALADKQWTKTHDELSRLLQFSPQLAQPGIPQFEEVSQYMAQLRKKIEQFPDGNVPAEAAKFYLNCLAQWTDSAEIVQKLSRLTDQLEADSQFDASLEIVNRLAELQPLNEELQARSVRVGHKAAQIRERNERNAEALKTWNRALADNRLYAAERALQTLEELDSASTATPEVVAFHSRLSEVRIEVQAIKQLAETTRERDPLIARYLTLLEKCRDCREALAALQTLSPDAPTSPVNLRVTLEANRRIIEWDAPPDGKRPNWYIVERSLVRAGTPQGESPFVIVHEGPDRYALDDEAIPHDTSVRYSVRGVLRGRMEIAGHVLQEYRVVSLPVATEPLLLYTEASDAALESEALDDIMQHAPEEIAAAETVVVTQPAGNPLKRFGLWPPVQN